MKFSVDIHQTNKNYVLQFNQKSAYKLEFVDHLWRPFIDEPQSDIVVFAIIILQVHNTLVTKQKHIIVPNDLITFNDESEFLSVSIIELVNVENYSR